MSLFEGVATVCFCGNSDSKTYIEWRGKEGTVSGRQCRICGMEWTTEEGNVQFYVCLISTVLYDRKVMLYSVNE